MTRSDANESPPHLAGYLRREADGLEIRLPSWPALALFQSSDSAESAGWLALRLGEDGGAPLGRVQIAAIALLVREHASIGRAISNALSLAMPEIRVKFGDDASTSWGEDIGRHVIPRCLFLHDVGGGQTLTGVQLSCDWDPEHGLGVVLRGASVLGVDEADASFLAWVARAAAKGSHHFGYWNAPDVV